ncbi:MAG: type VI secretion protein IcmF/TssM N-terminal domain-containing protein [Pirellulales bacterium]
MQFLSNLINAITAPIRLLYQWFTQLIPGIRSFANFSLPLRTALMMAMFLIVVIAASIVIHIVEGRSPHVFGSDSWWVWGFVAGSALLVIPVLAYWFMRFWLIEEKSPFPEIDRIWKESLAAIESQGMSIRTLPVFVVLGTSGEKLPAALRQSSGVALPIHVPKQMDADLIISAGPDAMFLFLNGCSSISRLSKSPPPRAGWTENQAAGNAGSGTIDAAMLGDRPFAQQASPISQTMNESLDPSKTAQAPASDYLQPSASPSGTLLLPDGHHISDIIGGGPSVEDIPLGRQLTSTDSADAEARLRHVCKLINKTRAPLCPINGILTTMPFELILSSPSQLQLAAQADLAVLRKELLVRCQNNVLVTGMEKEEGFQELMNRMGTARCRDFRFGKGSELWSVADAERLEAIAIHAAGAFEDWTYMLFQDENALKKRYNTRLFTLLCKVRGAFTKNLKNVLAGSCGFHPLRDAHLAHEQFLFGGCYFAATGDDPSKQAFVSSVFKKILEKEGDLEWTSEARRRDSQVQLLANLAALAGTLAIVAIVAMIVIHVRK